MLQLYEGAFVFLGAGAHSLPHRCSARPVPPYRGATTGGNQLVRPYHSGGPMSAMAAAVSPNHVYVYPAIRTSDGAPMPANRQSTVSLSPQGRLLSSAAATTTSSGGFGGIDTFRVWIARAAMEYVPVVHSGTVAGANGVGPAGGLSGVKFPISQHGPSARQKFDPDHPIDDFLQTPETSAIVAVDLCVAVDNLPGEPSLCRPDKVVALEASDVCSKVPCSNECAGARLAMYHDCLCIASQHTLTIQPRLQHYSDSTLDLQFALPSLARVTQSRAPRAVGAPRIRLCCLF